MSSFCAIPGIFGRRIHTNTDSFFIQILFYNCIPDFLQESLNASADGPELKDTIPNDGKIH